VPDQRDGEQKPATAPDGDQRVNFSARVRESVRRRARLYAAGHDVNLQDLMDAALDEYLRRRNA
jgi:hypothetical protein